MDINSLHVTDIGLVSWYAAGPFKDGYLDELEMELTSDFFFPHDEENCNVRTHILVDFFYPDSKDTAVLRGEVSTSFLLEGISSEDLAQVSADDQYYITMLSVSISHTRAVLEQQSKALGLSGFILPLLNPTETFRKMLDH